MYLQSHIFNVFTYSQIKYNRSNNSQNTFTFHVFVSYIYSDYAFICPEFFYWMKLLINSNTRLSVKLFILSSIVVEYDFAFLKKHRVSAKRWILGLFVSKVRHVKHPFRFYKNSKRLQIFYTHARE